MHRPHGIHIWWGSLVEQHWVNNNNNKREQEARCWYKITLYKHLMCLHDLSFFNLTFIMLKIKKEDTKKAWDVCVYFFAETWFLESPRFGQQFLLPIRANGPTCMVVLCSFSITLIMKSFSVLNCPSDMLSEPSKRNTRSTFPFKHSVGWRERSDRFRYKPK